MPVQAKHRTALVGAALFASTLALYWPLSRFGYFAVDDDAYVAQNLVVQAGLTREGIAWAFTSVGYAANWHPLTWLSLMLDVELSGSGARVHHLVNVLLHAVNSVLVLVVFRMLTGAVFKSALVAALFAFHPLHVESVAWISERKDVLSALFWLLATAAHVRYARRPGAARYSLVVVCMALGIMAKPMLVTLPFALLLLDWWPLGRLAPRVGGMGGALLEKAPLLALSALSALMTLLPQSKGGMVAPLEGLSMGHRFANALTAYVAYAWKMFLPFDLAFWYPHPGRSLPLREAAAAGALLAAASAAAILQIRRLPFLAAGWFWYLGTLLPVIGLVQVGAQAMADRYTYLPLLGLFLCVAWGAAAAVGRFSSSGVAAGAAALLVLGGLGALTSLQIGFWRDSESVFTRALAVTPRNWVMRNNLGELLLAQGRDAEAAVHFREAADLVPRFPGVRARLALALEKQGLLDDAALQYEELLRLDPGFPMAHFALGNISARRGRSLEAVARYRAALRGDPRHDGAHNNLGTVLLALGDGAGASAHFGEAVRLNPRNAEARNNLGSVLFEQGRPAEALDQYREALSARPGYVTAMMGCVRVHLALGDREESRRWLLEVLRADPGNAEARALLAQPGP